MRRREFMTLLGAAALATPALSASAQPARVFRLGTLSPVAAIPDAPVKVLVETLGRNGYVLGQNLAIEARAARGDVAKLPGLLQELKASNVDAIVCGGFPSAMAAKATGFPTVVYVGVGDPVATGLVASLAHPGGNITGISDVAATLTTKRLELLKEAVPKLRRVAMLWNKDDRGMSLRYDASAKVAQSTGLTVQALGVRAPDDFDEAFAAMTSTPPDAILMVSDSLTTLNRKRVFDFAVAHRLPAMYEYDFLVRDGGLMSYGADINESMDRAASLVTRIFKGAQPGDLPFEQPTRYPFVINLKTAKATGVEFPPQVLALADEVIE